MRGPQNLVLTGLSRWLISGRENANALESGRFGFQYRQALLVLPLPVDVPSPARLRYGRHLSTHTLAGVLCRCWRFPVAGDVPLELVRSVCRCPCRVLTMRAILAQVQS